MSFGAMVRDLLKPPSPPKVGDATTIMQHRLWITCRCLFPDLLYYNARHIKSAREFNPYYREIDPERLILALLNRGGTCVSATSTRYLLAPTKPDVPKTTPQFIDYTNSNE